MTATGPKPATFCYRCGRRVGKENEQCWYCGAPTRRWIRKPKRCPFCGEDIRAEAVKCRHCGEFIDGRPRPAEAPAQQIIFVVDRNMFRGMAEDARLLAGQPVPQDVARMLDAQTVRAIETGQPRLIAQAGVRALPAPAGGGEAGILDIEPLPNARALPAPDGHRGAAGSANLPARRGETAPAHPAASGALAVGKALVKGGGWLARKALSGPPPKPQGDGTIDAQARDLYRVCARCQSEILTQDNYCFHCGMQYQEFRADQFEPMRVLRRRSLPKGQYLLSIVLLAAYVGLRTVPVEFPYAQLAIPASGGLAALVGFYGVVANRGLIRKFFSLVLAALAVAALVLIK